MVLSTWQMWLIGATILLVVVLWETVRSEKGRREFADMTNKYGTLSVMFLITLVAVLGWPLIVAMVIHGLIQDRKN